MAAAQRSQASLDFCDDTHASSLLQRLLELRSDNLLVDVILCVSGKEIQCHRNVLAACSEYFRAMFCNGHRESKEHKVTIHEVSSNTLQLLVDYAYTSKIMITEGNAVNLLEGANFFQIQPVYDACVKFISDHVNAKNCMKMVHVGSMLSCPDLEKKARLCALKEFAEASKTSEFLCLTKDKLITLISSDNLNASEETVYEAVMTWINHNSSEREKEMRELMELVRFPFMDKIYFVKNVETNEAVHKSCQDVVMETRMYQLFPGEVQSPRTRPRRASGLREAMVVIGGIEEMEIENEGETPVYVFPESITMTYSAKPSSSSWTDVMEQYEECVLVGAVLGTSDIILSCGTDVWLFQPELNSWSTLARKNSDQFDHKLAVLQGKVYAIGGRITGRSVEIYNRSQNRWTDGVPLPEPRYMHAAAVLDGTIYVFGGFDAEHKPTSTVYCFRPGDSQWQSLRDMPTAAAQITASVLNGCIYVVGVPSSVLCFSPSIDGGSWSSLAIPGVKVKPMCGMTVFRGKIYICGGFENDKGSPEVLCLDPETHSVKRVGTMPKGRYAHTCVTILKYCGATD